MILYSVCSILISDKPILMKVTGRTKLNLSNNKFSDKCFYRIFKKFKKFKNLLTEESDSHVSRRL